MPEGPIIHVIDDEAPLRRSLIFLFESAGWQVIGHPSAESFLQAAPILPAAGGCLVLDVRMPGMSGLELQRRLRASSSPWPIVFLSSHGDAELAAQARAAGAIDFLGKPCSDYALLAAIERAIAASCAPAALTDSG